MSYTILAIDRTHGIVGAATASRSLAVGNAVIAIDPAIGVVASQAWTNTTLRPLLLGELARGASAGEAVERVPEWDDRAELRQVAALGFTGGGAARTGTSTTPWTGHLVDADLVLIGNLLTGPDVLAEARSAFRSCAPAAADADADIALESLASALMTALTAAEDAGGDARGKQSAAILVARRTASSSFPPEYQIDLRVDDDDEPVRRLAGLLAELSHARANPESPELLETPELLDAAHDPEHRDPDGVTTAAR